MRLFSLRKQPLPRCITITLIAIFLTSCSSEATPKPSRLERIEVDKPVYQFVRGSGDDNALSLSAKLSLETPYFVVFVATDDKHYSQAVAHAKKLAAWFERNKDTPDEIPVVVWHEGEGVGYTYHISGWPYLHDTYSPASVMTPQTSVAALEDAVLEYLAKMEMRNRGDSRLLR